MVRNHILCHTHLGCFCYLLLANSKYFNEMAYALKECYLASNHPIFNKIIDTFDPEALIDGSVFRFESFLSR